VKEKNYKWFFLLYFPVIKIVVNKPTDNVTGISSASFDETNFFKWKTFISRKFFHRIEHQYPHIKLKELHIVPRFGKEKICVI